MNHSKKDQFSRAASRDLKQSLRGYQNSTINPDIQNLSVNIDKYDLKKTSKFYYPYDSSQNLDLRGPRSEIANQIELAPARDRARRMNHRANIGFASLGNEKMGFSKAYRTNEVNVEKMKGSVTGKGGSTGRGKEQFWDRLKDMNQKYGSKHLDQFYRIYRSQEPKKEILKEGLEAQNNYSKLCDMKKSVKGILHSPDPRSSYFLERDSHFLRKSNEHFFKENERLKHRENMRQFYKRGQIISRNVDDLIKKEEAFKVKSETMKQKRKYNQENGNFRFFLLLRRLFRI